MNKETQLPLPISEEMEKKVIELQAFEEKYGHLNAPTKRYLRMIYSTAYEIARRFNGPKSVIYHTRQNYDVAGDTEAQRKARMLCGLNVLTAMCNIGLVSKLS